MGGICPKLAQVLIQDFNSMGFARAMAGISNFEFGLSNSRSADGIFDADNKYSSTHLFSTCHRLTGSKFLCFDGYRSCGAWSV